MWRVETGLRVRVSFEPGHVWGFMLTAEYSGADDEDRFRWFGRG